eukprot:3076548-Pyramimonas_sp.AAC.1
MLDTTIDAKLILTPGQEARPFRQVKRRKAPGQDCISGDLLGRCSEALGRHYGPTPSKASIHQQEPLGWKHGIAVARFKGVGSPAVLGHCRSILLNSQVNECWHRLLRDQLSGNFHLLLRDTQAGGRARRGAVQLLHVVSSLLQ